MTRGSVGVEDRERAIVWAVRHCLQRGWRDTSQGVRVLVRNWGALTESTKRRIIAEIMERIADEAGRDPGIGLGT